MIACSFTVGGGGQEQVKGQVQVQGWDGYQFHLNFIQDLDHLNDSVRFFLCFIPEDRYFSP